MRVLFDHQVFAFQRYGGISRYFVRLAQAFAAGNQVTPVVAAPVHVNGYLGELPSSIALGVRIPASNINQRIARLAGRLAMPAIASICRANVVHETYFSPHGTALRQPRVLTVYDMIHERFAEMYHPDDPTRRVKRKAVLRADHVICISESTRRDLIEFIPEAETKSSVALLGYDELPARRGGGDVAAGRPYLLYVGERGRYKNFARLLEAFAGSSLLSRDFRLLCFGGGPLAPVERKLVIEHRLDPALVQQLSGSDALLADCYRSAAALVYPSLYEGFGIPPLEAMAAGCPVLCSNRSSLPEVCGDAAAYFEPDSVESMRAAIEEVVSSVELQNRLIAFGRERLDHFSWAKCAAETSAVYKALQ